MSPSNYIVDVNEADFQAEVLLYSSERPVVVDFWAAWCAPCKMLAPVLEKLAQEHAGGFRLAKVDVDSNPNLALQFGVRSIPSVKAFRNGQIVAEFNGMRPEADIRLFLDALQPALGDVATGQADALLRGEDWEAAEGLYRDALDNDPDHPGALLGLARSLLAQGLAAAALPILREFPVSKQYGIAEQLIPLAEAMIDADEPSESGDALHALAANAVRLAGNGQLLAAMDGLLDVLRANKQHAGGRTRQLFLACLAILGDDNPTTRSYRSDLAALLF